MLRDLSTWVICVPSVTFAGLELSGILGNFRLELVLVAAINWSL